VLSDLLKQVVPEDPATLFALDLDDTPADTTLVLRFRTKQMIKRLKRSSMSGNVRLLEPVRPGRVRRALVTILEERPRDRPGETLLGAATACSVKSPANRMATPQQ
jgi:hypothetical protein